MNGCEIAFVLAVLAIACAVLAVGLSLLALVWSRRP
jgi:hypothetical protein